MAEAARALSVQNVGTIGRWAREGRLEGCSVGDGLRVSRRSVERMAESPVVARHRTWERELDHVLAELDFSNEELGSTSAILVNRVEPGLRGSTRGDNDQERATPS